jgi:hypothetical protein
MVQCEKWLPVLELTKVNNQTPSIISGAARIGSGSDNFQLLRVQSLNER